MVKVQRGDIMEPLSIQSYSQENDPERSLIQKKLTWFEDQKLGVIFHWGLYAEAGIVESWQLSEEDEWARKPVAWREDVKELQRDYWNLIETFNPTEFDPKEWARLCRQAGFKYMIFTTKHHDGFHLYDTQESDFKVGGSRSPYKGDIYRDVVEAFRDEGIAIGAYYSKADWYSPDYWVDNGTKKGRRANYDTLLEADRWERYVQYVHRELEEITQNYGQTDILWLDAGWCGKGREDLRMDELAEKVRKTNPDLLIVDRMMGGRHENYVTPERRIPRVQEIPNQTWESNIPLGRDWGYVPTDRYKSSQEIISLVIDVVTKGGNLLLGVGPKPDGTFTEESKKILNDLGQWLTVNGEGIYGTRAISDLTDDRQWKVTKKETYYYGFYEWPKGCTSPKELVFSKQDVEGHPIKGIWTLDKGEIVDFKEKGTDYLLTLPKRDYAWDIIALKIEIS